MLVRVARDVAQTTLILLATATAVVAEAEPRRIGTVPIDWQCVQEHDQAFHVLCVPRLFASDSDLAALVPAPTSPPLSAPGATAADMRPVAQRGDAEVLSADAWRVPLHAAPTDLSRVTALLASVLCGNRSACSVRYGTPALQSARR